jgi:ABC-type Na+ efflux pump permease subunit
MNKSIIQLIDGISIVIFVIFIWIYENKPDHVAYKSFIAISGIIHLITSWLIFLLYNEFSLRTTYTGKDGFFMLLLISIFLIGLIIYLMKK